MTNMLERLIQQVQTTQHGFTDMRAAADEVIMAKAPEESILIPKKLLASDAHQARMLATFILRRLAATSQESLNFLKNRVSQDMEWRVQEILAKAFDNYCFDIGYEKPLP